MFIEKKKLGYEIKVTFWWRKFSSYKGIRDEGLQFFFTLAYTSIQKWHPFLPFGALLGEGRGWTKDNCRQRRFEIYNASKKKKKTARSRWRNTYGKIDGRKTPHNIVPPFHPKEDLCPLIHLFYNYLHEWGRLIGLMWHAWDQFSQKKPSSVTTQILHHKRLRLLKKKKKFLLILDEYDAIPPGKPASGEGINSDIHLTRPAHINPKPMANSGMYSSKCM